MNIHNPNNIISSQHQDWTTIDPKKSIKQNVIYDVIYCQTNYMDNDAVEKTEEICQQFIDYRRCKMISIKMIMKMHNPNLNLILVLKVKIMIMIMIQIILIIYPVNKQIHIIKKTITIK